MLDATSFSILVAGPFVGSFIGVLVTRIPARRGVLISRSCCDSCGHLLAISDLIPWVSWLWLRGRCRYCSADIGLFHPLIEAAALGIGLLAAMATSGPALIASGVLGWTLLALAIIDWRTYTLPDTLVFFLIVVGLFATAILSPTQLAAHIVGAIIGYISFAALAWIYRKARGRDGLGLGDAKLLAALGMWLSWEGLPSVVLLAGLIGLSMVLTKNLRQLCIDPLERVPFGTFLATGGWIVWLCGPLNIGAPR